VDGNGTILNHVVYDSYGQVVGQSDATVEFRFGYTGREQDAETGLDYYRARYYDASNGRFISEEPIGFSAGDSNLTRYVGNSPTNWVDPSGLQETIPGSGLIEGLFQGATLIYGAKTIIDNASYSAGQVIGEGIRKGADYASKGGFFNGGGLSAGTVPNTTKRKTTTNPGEFDPNYGVKNKPTTSFSPIYIRTSGSTFKVPNKTTFPGTGTCSIGGQLPPRAGHGLNDNLFIRFFSSEWDPFNPKAIWDNSVNLNDLRNAANKVIPDNNMGLTVGSRALDKHANKQGGRGTTPFPKLKGGPKERNRVAAEQVDDIITSPDAVFVRLGGGGLEVRIPDGRGARWDSDGSFSGFVN
jgi:RHS repeat-associated protein